MSRYHHTDRCTSGELVALNAALATFHEAPWDSNPIARAALRRVWGKVTRDMTLGQGLVLTEKEKTHTVKLCKHVLKHGLINDAALTSALNGAVVKLGSKPYLIAA